ncbi:family 16 glycosylhydrolase [Sphingomonas sp. SRS2]|uniref:family 16 glycosylhydrolase n=1 Tax=Sphingomonas sp. SRS2 TaxID=133190 RepID=UPI00069809AA|nr:family 16 glycosylhydrolase [Sphingomonas sp. SRS2]
MAYLNYFGQTMPTTPWSSNVITGSTSAGSAGTTLYGTAGSDNIEPKAVLNLAGGAGSDGYQYVTTATRVNELAGQGTDTLFVINDYAMPDNVENLTIWYARAVIGNSLGNLIIGSSGSQTINGGGGNDLLQGKGGNDVFRFDAGSGHDVISDFVTSGSDADMVRLAGYGHYTSLAQIKAAMTQSGGDVILQLDGDDAIKFTGRSIADFQESNFELGIDRSILKLTFNEDFDSLSLWNGATGVWRTNFGNDYNPDALSTRTLNDEREIYIDPMMKGTGVSPIGVSPFSLSNGVLTITASPTPEHLRPVLYDMDYVSGLLTTRQSFAQQYGYFEARMDVPDGKGMWPAFWLLPADGDWPPEIDVMENYGGAQTSFTVHSDASGTHSEAYAFDFDPKVAQGFHTYGVLWSEEKIVWYLDGVEIYEQPTPPDLHKPMYMLLNLAVAKEAALGMTGEVKIDYVRAYTVDPALANVQNLIGSSADDRYTVTSSGDRITELAGGGVDSVTARADYVLPENIEKLTLTDNAVSGTGNASANSITGNVLDNRLSGLGGNDTINGGGGADLMTGGAGNDSYYVDHSGDRIVEQAGEGTDNVSASVNYTLSANVENLTLTGSALRGAGNDGANSITGNAANNELLGGGGNDMLKGGAGADRMIGETGNDNYYVDAAGDMVIELSGEGTDNVFSSIDALLAANVENLTLTGAALRGAGNDRPNALTGNGLDNILDGLAGNDTLKGNAGADGLNGGGGNDRLSGGAGSDRFIFEMGFGKDVIDDFDISQDRIDWSALAAADILPVISATSVGSLVSFGSDSISFLGVAPEQLLEHDIF